jgi:predicted adenine nucleotide alpha hydrolase (AANH) superfamily ATPase
MKIHSLVIRLLHACRPTDMHLFLTNMPKIDVDSTNFLFYDRNILPTTVKAYIVTIANVPVFSLL